MNLTWSTDSLLPVLHYAVAFRRSQVITCNLLTADLLQVPGLTSSSTSDYWRKAVIPVMEPDLRLTTSASYILRYNIKLRYFIVGIFP